MYALPYMSTDVTMDHGSHVGLNWNVKSFSYLETVKQEENFILLLFRNNDGTW